MQTYGLWNWKGGVGKTTSTLNVAAHLADQHGLRVVTVDFDPQATLTKLAGLTPSELDPAETILGALLDDQFDDVPDAGQMLRDAPWGGRLLPGTPDLAGAEPVLASVPGPHRRLARALSVLEDHADVVLIDGPPRTGHLAFNLLGASDGLFVPVALSYTSATSLEPLFGTVKLFSEHERTVPVLGVFGTMARHTRHASETMQGLTDQLGDLLMDAIIPATVSVEDALIDGHAAYQLDPRTIGAVAYERFTREFAARAKLPASAVA